MGGIMFNEDCNHFVYSRCRVNTKVGLHELQLFIDQYKGTPIKEFIMNINSMIAWFPSKTWENVIDKYIKLKECGKDLGDIGNAAALSYDIFVRQGIDMYKVWIDRLRENGMSPWLSVRMNDLHNNEDEEHFLHSSFFSSNKHLRRASHRPHSSYYDNALSYNYPEVREHYLSLICEIAERYDFDGLELDWMREPFSLKIGTEWEGTNILTKFMRQVRSIIDEFEKIRKHKIKIGVRVPFSPDIALRFGFDTIVWAKEKLVDIMVPSPRWATIDNDMPIDLWKRLLDGTDAMLGAGLEILIEAVRKTPKRFMFNSVETARGSAASYFSMGADRIYLFNYMDLPDAQSFDPRMAGSAVDPSNYFEFLNSIGEPDTAYKHSRRHVLTYHDITAPGVKVSSILPLNIQPPCTQGTMNFSDVRIATGFIDKNSKVCLILGINSPEKLGSSDFLVYLNGAQCEFNGAVNIKNPKPDCAMYSFSQKYDGTMPNVSIVEIASKTRPFEIEWIEIDIQP